MRLLSSKKVLGGGEDKFTVGLVRKDKSTTRLLKIVYSPNDGSYFVTFPYHQFKGQAVLAKFTVNYSKLESAISHEEMLDVASSEEMNNAIKLSHHPSGLVQFSGGGIISGPNSSGFHLQSWPLSNPAPGPAFAVSFFSLEGVSKKQITDVACLFSEADLSVDEHKRVLVVEAFYFPWEATKHTQLTLDGERVITIRRPMDGKALQLKVLTPPKKCWGLGFLAVHMWCDEASASQKMEGLGVTTPTGNLRINANGEMLADSLLLGYPRIIRPIRNIDYTPPMHLTESVDGKWV